MIKDNLEIKITEGGKEGGKATVAVYKNSKLLVGTSLDPEDINRLPLQIGEITMDYFCKYFMGKSIDELFNL